MIHRIEHKSNFTITDRAYLFDNRLSNRAKGTLTIMLSMPDDWNFSIRGLAAICRDGAQAISNDLRELEKAGYLSRKRVRSRGRIASWSYEVFEVSTNPQGGAENHGEDFSDAQNAASDNTKSSDEACSDRAFFDEDFSCKAYSEKDFSDHAFFDADFQDVDFPHQESAPLPSINKPSTVKPSVKKESKARGCGVGAAYRRESFDDIISGIENIKVRGLFRSYVRVRAKNKLPLTNDVLHMLIERLYTLSDSPSQQTEIISRAIMGGWNDFFPVSDVREQSRRDTAPEGAGDLYTHEYDDAALERILWDSYE